MLLYVMRIYFCFWKHPRILATCYNLQSKFGGFIFSFLEIWKLWAIIPPKQSLGASLVCCDLCFFNFVM
jgi:hypothetical protein